MLPNEVTPFEGDGIDDYGWLMKAILDLETDQAMDLGRILIEEFNPRNVIDFGCGPGIYLVPFKEAGLGILGLDSCEVGGESIPGNFKRTDLRFPYNSVPHKPLGLTDLHDLWDLALCIETAEHLQCEYSETLVKSLCDTANRVFFTAAVPGQGGHYHFCCRPKEEWADMFATQGFVHDPKEEHIINRIRNEARMERDKWLLNNSQVFVRA